MNKRGILYEEIIFYLLNLVFLAVLLIFIVSQANGRPVYEQAYAKQIALLIDEAKPTMTIILDMQQALDIAKKNKFTGNIVEIDEKNRKVVVRLGKGGGYGFKYFTDAKITPKFQTQKNNDNTQTIYLVIGVEKNV